MECVTASELTLVAVSALTCPGLSQQSSGQVACLYEFKVHAPEKLHTDVYESGHSLSPVLVPFFFLILYNTLLRTTTHFNGKYLVPVFHPSIT